MTFQELEQRYTQLLQAWQNGQLTENQFVEQVSQLRLQDEQGRWWQIRGRDGVWLRWDGQHWVVAQPPQMTVQQQEGQPAQSRQPAAQPEPATVPAPSERQKSPAIPQTTAQFFALLLKGFLKRLPLKLALAGALALVIWILHTYLLIGPNSGFNPDPDKPILSALLALRGQIVVSTLVWSLMVALLVTAVTRTIRLGPGQMIRQIGGTPGWLRRSAQEVGGLTLPLLLLGAAGALFLGTLSTKRLVDMLLAITAVTILIARHSSVILFFFHLVWSDLQRLLNIDPPRDFSLAWSGLIVSGVALGFGGAALQPFYPYCGGIGVLLLFLAAGFFLLRQQGGPAGGGRLVAALLFVTALSLWAAPVLADDGGWSESGGTLIDWLQSPGAAEAVGLGFLPALGVGLVSLLAVASSTLASLLSAGGTASWHLAERREGHHPLPEQKPTSATEHKGAAAPARRSFDYQGSASAQGPGAGGPSGRMAAKRPSGSPPAKPDLAASPDPPSAAGERSAAADAAEDVAQSQRGDQSAAAAELPARRGSDPASERPAASVSRASAEATSDASPAGREAVDQPAEAEVSPAESQQARREESPAVADESLALREDSPAPSEESLARRQDEPAVGAEAGRQAKSAEASPTASPAGREAVDQPAKGEISPAESPQARREEGPAVADESLARREDSPAPSEESLARRQDDPAAVAEAQRQAKPGAEVDASPQARREESPAVADESLARREDSPAPSEESLARRQDDPAAGAKAQRQAKLGAEADAPPQARREESPAVADESLARREDDQAAVSDDAQPAQRAFATAQPAFEPSKKVVDKSLTILNNLSLAPAARHQVEQQVRQLGEEVDRLVQVGSPLPSDFWGAPRAITGGPANVLLPEIQQLLLAWQRLIAEAAPENQALLQQLLEPVAALLTTARPSARLEQAELDHLPASALGPFLLGQSESESGLEKLLNALYTDEKPGGEG